MPRGAGTTPSQHTRVQRHTHTHTHTYTCTHNLHTLLLLPSLGIFHSGINGEICEGIQGREGPRYSLASINK